MAAPLLEDPNAAVRERIETEKLVKELQDYGLQRKRNGVTVRMDTVRMKAIEILLKKTLPDLQGLAVTGEGGKGPVKLTVEWVKP